jgi:hypothetical protein
MTIHKWLVRLSVFAAAMLIAAMVPASVSAQTLTGTISGRATDAQGGALPGVLVTLVSRTGEATQTTEEEGRFRFLGLNTGVYELRTTLDGFKPTSRPNLEITIG